MTKKEKVAGKITAEQLNTIKQQQEDIAQSLNCLLYTSDAADE